MGHSDAGTLSPIALPGAQSRSLAFRIEVGDTLLLSSGNNDITTTTNNNNKEEEEEEEEEEETRGIHF